MASASCRVAKEPDQMRTALGRRLPRLLRLATALATAFGFGLALLPDAPTLAACCQFPEAPPPCCPKREDPGARAAIKSGCCERRGVEAATPRILRPQAERFLPKPPLAAALPSALRAAPPDAPRLSPALFPATQTGPPDARALHALHRVFLI
jgi:hypothetical protein